MSSIADSPHKLIPLSALERPIAYHRVFRRISKSTTAALFLSQAWYWTQRLPDDRDGWFYKTSEEWEEETGLSRHEQQTARKHLKESGFIEEERRGIDPTLWYRLDVDVIVEAINATDPAPGSVPPTPVAVTRYQEMPHPGTTCRHDPPLLHTEITADTSTETTASPKRKSGGVHDLINAFSDAVGITQPTSYSTAIGQAKTLLKAGATPEQVTACTLWLLADPYWQERGVNLGTVLSQWDKFRTRGVVVAAPSKPKPNYYKPNGGLTAEGMAAKARGEIR